MRVGGVGRGEVEEESGAVGVVGRGEGKGSKARPLGVVGGDKSESFVRGELSGESANCVGVFERESA